MWKYTQIFVYTAAGKACGTVKHHEMPSRAKFGYSLYTREPIIPMKMKWPNQDLELWVIYSDMHAVSHKCQEYQKKISSLMAV